MGFDLDFVEVRQGKIIAFTDIKQNHDKITWIEKQCYPQLEEIAPVLIIEINKELSEYKIYNYKNEENSLTFNKRDFYNDFLPNIETYINNVFKFNWIRFAS